MDTNETLIKSALTVAVPIWIAAVREMTPEQRMERAHDCLERIQSAGENILYRSKKEGVSADGFNAVAEGIACLAFCPGGVTVFDQHWEAAEGAEADVALRRESERCRRSAS
jgi:hypothetical protein